MPPRSRSATKLKPESPVPATPAAPESPSPAATTAHHRDQGYELLRELVADRIAGPVAPLFTTDATDLFDLFLSELPADERRGYTCQCCRAFFDRHAGLVTIDAQGQAESLLWRQDGVPGFFSDAVAAVRSRARHAAVTGVFVTNEALWGRPMTGPWSHFYGRPHPDRLYRGTPLKNAEQRAAELLQDYQVLQRGLADVADQAGTHRIRAALALLERGQLAGAEKAEGTARWLLQLLEARAATKNRTARDNLTWSAVATAPAGFAHFKTTVLGTLLDDLAQGLELSAIQGRWGGKLDPLTYQRAQVAPSEGQVDAAERVVATLGLEQSLARRFARREHLVVTWEPPQKPQEASPGGPFAHLRPARATITPLATGPVTITWEKFARTVLGAAERIEFQVPGDRANFVAFVTAQHPNAPPILQWDLPERRNPTSLYGYVNGSFPERWGLQRGAWREVTAITLQPHQWDAARDYPQHGRGVVLLLRGARDTGYQAGGGFFPATLRGELHGVRATLEAHAKTAAIADLDGAGDAGIAFLERKDGRSWGCVVRVTTAGITTTYHVDRWD